MTHDEPNSLRGKTFRADKPFRFNHDSDSYTYGQQKCVECVRIKNAKYKRAAREERARTALPNMTDSHLRQAAVKGNKAANRATDDRDHEVRAVAYDLLALPPVPDFMARAEERIQAVRAQS